MESRGLRAELVLNTQSRFRALVFYLRFEYYGPVKTIRPPQKDILTFTIPSKIGIEVSHNPVTFYRNPGLFSLFFVASPPIAPIWSGAFCSPCYSEQNAPAQIGAFCAVPEKSVKPVSTQAQSVPKSVGPGVGPPKKSIPRSLKYAGPTSKRGGRIV